LLALALGLSVTTSAWSSKGGGSRLFDIAYETRNLTVNADSLEWSRGKPGGEPTE